MPAHVDQFEAILSYMPECGYVPTSSDRFEWFLPSVTEGIYASAKTLSLTQQINGTLEWGNLVHLFNHTCYQQYSHFQVAELQMNKTKLTQNALKIGQTPCPLQPDSQHTSAECKKLRELRSSGPDKGKRTGKGTRNRHNSSHSAPRTYPNPKKGKGYGGGKGKDKGQRSNKGDTPNPFKDMECSHCGKKGHPARNCYKCLNASPKLSQNTTTITEPATTIAFQQYVTYVKRKADKQESDVEKDQDENEDTTLVTDDWGSSSATAELTWGRTSTAQYEDSQHEWQEEASSHETLKMNYSPERNPSRSVTCAICAENIRTSKMNGPILCRRCREQYASSPLRTTTNKPTKEVIQDNKEDMHTGPVTLVMLSDLHQALSLPLCYLLSFLHSYLLQRHNLKTIRKTAMHKWTTRRIWQRGTPYARITLVSVLPSPLALCSHDNVHKTKMHVKDTRLTLMAFSTRQYQTRSRYTTIYTLPSQSSKIRLHLSTYLTGQDGRYVLTNGLL